MKTNPNGASWYQIDGIFTPIRFSFHYYVNVLAGLVFNFETLVIITPVEGKSQKYHWIRCMWSVFDLWDVPCWCWVAWSPPLFDHAAILYACIKFLLIFKDVTDMISKFLFIGFRFYSYLFGLALLYYIYTNLIILWSISILV